MAYMFGNIDGVDSVEISSRQIGWEKYGWYLQIESKPLKFIISDLTVERLDDMIDALTCIRNAFVHGDKLSQVCPPRDVDKSILNVKFQEAVAANCSEHS